jgi:hypothetical protein
VITICPSGCNYTPSQLQTAVNAAVPGDIITIDPSVAASTTTGLSLPVLVNPNHLYVAIRSSHIYNLPGGVRVTPTNADLATITDTAKANHVLYTTVSGGLGSSYFRFEGIKFIGPPNDANLSIMIQLGQFQYPTNDHEVSQLPHDLIFDRCVFSGYPGIPGPKNAFDMNSGRVTIKDSYFYEIKYVGAESHDVAEWNGTGPFIFTNTHFEASTEETIFGGAAPIIAGVRPSATLTGNEYYKPWAWRYTTGAAAPTGVCMYGADRGGEWYSDSSAGGLIYNCNSSNIWVTTAEAALASMQYENPSNYTSGAVDPTGSCTSGRYYKNTATPSYWQCVGSAWTSITIGPFIGGVIGRANQWYEKNHFELKNAQRVLYEGNYIHNSWQPADGQQHGACFLFNQVDNSYQYGGDQSAGIFWAELRYNYCDSVPWMASTGTIAYGPSYKYFYPQHDNSIHDNLAINVGGMPFSQGDSLVEQLGVGSRQTFSYNTVITTQLPTTQSQAIQMYLINQSLLSPMPQFQQEMNVVGNILGWNWYGLHDGSDSKGSTNDAIAYDWGNNRALGRNVVLNQTSTTQSLGYNLFTASSIDGQQGCKDCANPAPTSYASIGFTNYATGDYHMTGTYGGQWAYGRPTGANIDQVNWMTAHAIDGLPNPFLDFKVRGVAKTATSVTFTYTAYDSNSCTANLSAFSGGSTLATASDLGGANLDRTLTVAGLMTKTPYWYSLICGPSGAYNRVGQFLTH